MLRVVICDDEERICRLIEALADWRGLGMEVVGLAYNGPDALERVTALTPDILITDIRMPGCDGLEVIRRGKEQLPDLEVIIISGYAQFDYAQTAIQYGVGDYLLKPINQEALNHTLGKLGKRCLSRQATRADMESLRMGRQDDLLHLRDNLLSDLCGAAYAPMDAQQAEQLYRFSFHADCAQVLMLKMDLDVDRFAPHSLDIMQQKAEDLFRPVLQKHCEDFVLGFRQTMLLGVMSYPSGRMSEVRVGLRECLNQLVELRGLFGEVAFSLSLGEAVKSPRELSQSFENARAMLCERLIEGTGRMLEGTFAASSIRARNPIAGYSKEIAKAVELLAQRDAERAAAALEGEAMAVPGVRGQELCELVRDAALLFVTRLAPENREAVLSAFAARCEHCASASDLFACLRSLQAQQLAQAARRRQNQDGQPIRLAKQYIQQNYQKPITLEEVGAEMGFSVNYFSTLFKKETGEGFAKYLARVRMEEARGLLRETRLSVADVCKRVGYSDLKHFTQTFKAATGLTPAEFRKLYG